MAVRWTGRGYLYVREDLRAELKPALTGWIAHQRPFAFETGAIDRREDSFRYLNGTRTFRHCMRASRAGYFESSWHKRNSSEVCADDDAVDRGR